MGLVSSWDSVQPEIKTAIGSMAYETWFSSLQVKENPPETLIIETPDEFFKNWLIEHYEKIIRDTLFTHTTKNIRVEFTTKVNTPSAAESSLKTLVPERPTAESKKEDLSLNPRFSFENFVVGPSNRFAYAACMAVAESPAKAYNPLFIYGPVGLGKTHLLQAITHQIKTNHPDTNYCYISSERFTNELINAIRHRSTNQFREKYRNIDVLLIDDIHFIAGKESTQEEFFHTFNTLHNNRKQIIISSDRSPKEIANLEERLSSRFAWGLITDIQAPDFETRVAILRKKIEREPVQVPDDVIMFIAEQIRTNIRELEGALIRVVAYSLLEEKSISLEMAKIVLKDMVKEVVRAINVEMIQRNVAEFFNITLNDLKANRRSRNVLLPRQIAMYLSRQMTTMSLPEIGVAFGGKDHTTVLHSYRKIDQNITNNGELKRIIENISRTLKQ